MSKINAEFDLIKEHKISTLFDDLAFYHYEWLQSLGYLPLNASFIEQMMLVVSECGEAVNAYRDEDMLAVYDELADIILRVFGIAHHWGMPIEDIVLAKMLRNFANGNKGRKI